MAKVPVTVVVLTYNEEHNIEACLKTVYGWAKEIIVVDDGSEDRTVDIAGVMADKILFGKKQIEGVKRNWAYAQAQNPWVLSLDADERVTPELRDEIAETIARNEYDVCSIPRRNYIGDYWVRYGGQYPAAQLKFFKKGKLRFEEVGVHPRAFIEGVTGHLRGDIIHYSYRDFGHFLSKLNSQTTWEAQKWLKEKNSKKRAWWHVFWRAIDRFFRVFVGKKGYKDGFVGFMMAYFASVYQIMSYAKYWEMRKKLQQEGTTQGGQ